MQNLNKIIGKIRCIFDDYKISFIYAVFILLIPAIGYAQAATLGSEIGSAICSVIDIFDAGVTTALAGVGVAFLALIMMFGQMQPSNAIKIGIAIAALASIPTVLSAVWGVAC